MNTTQRKQNLILSVWKNGEFKVQPSIDAEYSANDADWLCNIPLDRILETEQTTKEETPNGPLNKLTEASKPLIKHLNENHHPHVTAIVTPSGIELLEGVMSNPNITEFIKD